MAPFLRTPHNYDRNEASDEHGLHCKDPSLAQQQFKDESDINVLFAKYLETGLIPQVQAELSYAAFEGPFDFHDAMNAVRAAQEAFDRLPARIKNRFANDPNNLLEFLENPENRDEAIFLELVNKPKAPETANPAGATAGQPTGQPTPAAPTTPRP